MRSEPYVSEREVLMVPILLVILALAVLYWFPSRRWMSRWGATPSDLSRVMRGDGLLADPTYSYTMAVSINAPPEDIWAWLVQIGYQRGGLYSYDWLDPIKTDERILYVTRADGSE